MADIAAQIYRVVTANGPWFGCQWLSLSEHLSALIDNIFSLPAHADNGSRREELAQTLWWDTMFEIQWEIVK
jgi:hypothetical protein